MGQVSFKWVGVGGVGGVGESGRQGRLLSGDALGHAVVSGFHKLFQLLVKKFLFLASLMIDGGCLEVRRLFGTHRILAIQVGEVMFHA